MFIPQPCKPLAVITNLKYETKSEGSERVVLITCSIVSEHITSLGLIVWTRVQNS